MNKPRKGIILAGGTGSRLFPLTIATSKQLLPVYNKPMIYYPLSILMLAEIRDIAIIVNPVHREQFEVLLSNGEDLGISIQFIEQPNPDGLAQAFILAEAFLDGAPSALVLGDNIFFGAGLQQILKRSDERLQGASIFAKQVINPSDYGVVDINSDDVATSIIEKPSKPASNLAVTGLYFVDEHAPEIAKTIVPSNRGELEITSLLDVYMQMGDLKVERLGRGFAWFDTGTHDNLLEASSFVSAVEQMQGLLVGSPEEIALMKGWVTSEIIEPRLKLFGKSDYGKQLLLNAPKDFF